MYYELNVFNTVANIFSCNSSNRKQKNVDELMVSVCVNPLQFILLNIFVALCDHFPFA